MKHHAPGNVKAAALIIAALFAVNTQANENSLTSSTNTSPSVLEFKKADILYDYDEIFSFDIEKYLSENAPHLVPYAEAISHISGESTISPKVFITLIEQQSGLITAKQASETELEMPFGVMSQQYGFIEQLRDVAERLTKAYYKGHSFAETGKNQKFTADEDAQRAIQMIYSYGVDTSELQPGSAEQTESFTQLFFKMFPESKNSVAEPKASATTMAVPSTSMLQFPFPRGQSWHIGGSHTTSGSGNYPQSSLDSSQGNIGWGGNTSGKWVSASAAGRVKVYSSCSMEVFHDGGWSTSYYHLSNIQYSTNANVYKNTAIANYANTKNQALCNGGQSTGPHLHWSLKYNNQYYHLNGVTVSGFKIQTGRYSYDTNCSYFRLTKNGYYYCAGNFYNSGGTARTVDQKALGPVKFD
ncbi:M23 family metallopeptidase [Aliikangiella maris]|uniref:M23 family metallopeptidase n=2 Tax=Aliikangiella maris TaxID=3162458 RepID=A0ABV3MQG1_9GAMM